MSYGPDAESLKRAAYYVDRLLKGAQPTDYVEQLSKLKLIVNLRTAKTLGINIFRGYS